MKKEIKGQASQYNFRQYLFIAAIIAIAGIILGAVGLRVWEKGVMDRYVQRTPATVPQSLVESGGRQVGRQSARQPVMQPGGDWGIWRRQDWCVSSTCVVLWQTPYELKIQTAGKTPVTVDGVQGWLWRLQPDEFTEGPGGYAEEHWLEGSLKLALAQRFNSLTDALNRAYMYYDAASSRYGAYGRLSGPALALQWNKEGQSYLVMGQDESPVTEGVLRQMADSLVPLAEPEEGG